MNVINRAMRIAERRTNNRKEFYFAGWLTGLQPFTSGVSKNPKKGGTLMIDEESVITFE